MSKKESNKNIYIFWGAIALIIIIVLLVIFLPRLNTQQAFNNMYNISQNMEKQDTHNKTMEFYAQSFLGCSELTATEKSKAQSLFYLQQAMVLGTNYALTGLQFVENKKDLKGFINTQSNAYSKVKNTINEFLEYCQNNCYQFFDGTMDYEPGYLKDAFNEAYIVKYKIVIQQLSDFYLASADVLSNNATKGIEITENNLAKNQTLMAQIKTLAYTETPNIDACRICIETAISDYKNFN